EDASAHFGLGKLLEVEQRSKEAKAEFEHSIQMQPAQTESYYELDNSSSKYSMMHRLRRCLRKCWRVTQRTEALLREWGSSHSAARSIRTRISFWPVRRRLLRIISRLTTIVDWHWPGSGRRMNLIVSCRPPPSWTASNRGRPQLPREYPRAGRRTDLRDNLRDFSMA